jgi:deazaflavin-dependent oxidoreductase (nitroreductase family)
MKYSPIRWWQRIIQRMAMTDFLSSGFLSRYLHHIDAPFLKWSKGQHSLTTWLSGLPVVVLTTKGARTGKSRTIPLAGFPDGDNIVLVPSSFGTRHYPAWYYNLCANPQVQIHVDGETRQYHAIIVDHERRGKYWQLALDYYPGYQLYEQRSGGREIPIVLLEPVN